MKHLSITLIALLLFSSTFAVGDTKALVLNSAQVSKLDVTGKWTGKRQQYSWDKKSFIETFQYDFDLKQEGNIVTGTSTIINSNGEYADMIIEGVIIGNKLHFSETAVKNAIRPQGRVWCFKSGELNFVKNGDNFMIVGETPSYMEGYNLPCSGGVTNLTKVDNSTIDVTGVINAGGTATSTGVSPQININVFPNPFVQNANISYSLPKDAKVSAQVYDISGKLVNTLIEENQKAGNYNLTFNSKNNAQTSGIFIVKMTINGEVFSRQLVQVK